MSESNLPTGCVEAMEATLTLCEAINENNLTTKDLMAVCRMAIEDGHDMVLVGLAMMSTAIGRVAEEKS